MWREYSNWEVDIELFRRDILQRCGGCALIWRMCSKEYRYLAVMLRVFGNLEGVQLCGGTFAECV